jgi:hypothetical protein
LSAAQRENVAIAVGSHADKMNQFIAAGRIRWTFINSSADDPAAESGMSQRIRVLMKCTAVLLNYFPGE